jgi:serine/threonine protein phosphatase 1
MSVTYVVPDLHGRFDLLGEGFWRIFAHAAGQAGTVVMLGDYVDKGPGSRQVIDRLLSYGGDTAAVPQAHIAWLDQLPLMHRDPYRLYVHAGVDAGIALEQQTEKTLLNKRYPQGDPSGFGDLHVVHGHDNFPQGPLLYHGRSNLDTLAWRTGRLVIGVFDDGKAGGPVDLIEVRGSSANR